MGETVILEADGQMRALAEAQLLGWFRAQNGESLTVLVGSMGLGSEEWQQIQEDYGLEYMTDEDRQQITEFLEQKNHEHD